MLNRQLIAGCIEDEGRRLEGRQQTVGAAALMEQAHLRLMPDHDFELAEWAFPKVNKLGTVKVGTNTYSVPSPPGSAVRAKITPTAIEVWHEGRVIARHERCYARQQEVLDLEHYLGVLEQKPGALVGICYDLVTISPRTRNQPLRRVAYMNQRKLRKCRRVHPRRIIRLSPRQAGGRASGSFPVGNPYVLDLGCLAEELSDGFAAEIHPVHRL